MRLFTTVGVLAMASSAAALTPVKPYAISNTPDYEVVPLLSVGEKMPETDSPGAVYQFVGLPDGMGAYANDDGTISLVVNYELTQGTSSEPRVGRPLQRGAFASRYILDDRLHVLSGARLFNEVWNENDYVGPAAQADNATPAFSRFCSGFLAGPHVGFDRWTYLTGEEADAPAVFDGKGGLSVAILDGQAHALPALGRFSHENVVALPGTGRRTAIMNLEDGPSTPDSQLWMYVGQKDRRHGSTALGRNGLDNGKLYAFKSNDPARSSECNFSSGEIWGEWVEIPGAADMTEAELEAAADRAGAFGFVRIEDGASNPGQRDEFFFVTTGSSHTEAGAPAPCNKLGRAYVLKLDKKNPTGPARLAVVYNADTIVNGGGDVALSPDNIDASEDYLMIQEDGTAESRVVMAAKGRDGSIWRFPLDSEASWSKRVKLDARERVVELDPPGRDGVPVGPGIWETSGIIDTSELFGEGSWVFNVQAHRPTAAPAPNTVEDGQILLLRPRHKR